MKNLKKFIYLPIFAFLAAGSEPITAITVQIINEDINPYPKNGRINFQIDFKDGTTTRHHQEINISKWPQKKTAWKVTIPNFEGSFTSVLYKFLLDDGKRMSATGGLVIEQAWSSESQKDITVTVKMDKDAVIAHHSPELSPWSSENSQERTLVGDGPIYYVIDLK